MSNSSIWLINRTLSSATTPGQSEPGSNGNEGVLCIFQSSSITATLPLDCLMIYPGHSMVGVSYLSAEMQSVYSTAPADWSIYFIYFIIIWLNLNGSLHIFVPTRPMLFGEMMLCPLLLDRHIALVLFFFWIFCL